MEWKEAKAKLLEDKETREAYRKVDLGYEIGKMITDARIAKKMTQKKLAELVGTKQPSIARLENGNYLPSLSFLQKIANAFNTQLLPPRLEFLEIKNTNTISVTKVQIFLFDGNHRVVTPSYVKKFSPLTTETLDYIPQGRMENFAYANIS